MLNPEHAALLLPVLAGLLLGGVFFGGLWLTIRHTLTSRWLGFWLMGSLLLRSGLVLCGFHAVAAADWRRLIACLAGFILARFVIGWWLKLSLDSQGQVAPRMTHAP
jgi:F1F0 ATPase subunit 2